VDSQHKASYPQDCTRTKKKGEPQYMGLAFLFSGKVLNPDTTENWGKDCSAI
jgi:hypothetical protein